ncbi:MAG: Gldg family protein [Kofleriaceae bacterium]|nr:Gldg family protein [Kofleriaceae bacterium]MCB9571532.1 Gldg family protein [Kofleriaceae bacterium]
MRTATPWWLTWQHLLALLILFVAQRFLGHWSTLQLVATIASVAAIAATLGLRVVAVIRTATDRRAVERTLLLATIGSIAGIALWFLTTKTGAGIVGAGHLSAKGARRWDVSLTVLAAIVSLASIVPMVMIEATLGLARRDRFDLDVKGSDDAVEHRRVREVGLSGLTIALAGALLMVTCNVAGERNLRKDVSYFKTSSPGASTKNILKNTSEPIKVLLFFPEVNEVKDELEAYFEDLKDATHKVEIEAHDPIVAAGLATDYGVKEQGVVVLVRGDKHEKIPMDTDIERARRATKSTTKPSLRTFDGAVNAALMKLVRAKRVAYLTVGHGEINDPDSLDPRLREQLPDARANTLKDILRAQNYEIKNLGAMDGLADDVPEDATLVMVLGPRTALGDDELAALDRYVARGGSLLLALDPVSDATMGPLEGRLAVRFDHTPIADDKEFLPSGGPQVALTNQFSSHASITTLARAASNRGIPLVKAGTLEDAPYTGDGAEPKKTYVIRSMSTSFRDLNDNQKFDDGEKRDRYNIAAAIEGPKPAPVEGADPAEAKDGFRAMVFSDVDLFADRMGMQGRQILVYRETNGGPLPDDALRWLGGEENYAGDITSELDVAIRHSKKEDAWWFLLTIVGAPLLVLGAGLASTRRRLRAKGARPAATKAAPATAKATAKATPAKAAATKAAASAAAEGDDNDDDKDPEEAS